MQTQRSSILDDTIATIGAILGTDLDEIMIERVVVGLFFTGVKLSNGSAGGCATPIKTIPEAVCCPSSVGCFPGSRGRLAADVAREALSGHGIRRAVGIANQRAGSCCHQRRPHPEVELCPGIDASTRPKSAKATGVVVVGAFIRSPGAETAGQPFLVLEQDRPQKQMSCRSFARPNRRQILPESDGADHRSTLVSNTPTSACAGPAQGRRPSSGRRLACCPTPFSPATPMSWAASG
jgi:uncharacterized protein (DUF4213/DUF364 family)